MHEVISEHKFVKNKQIDIRLVISVDRSKAVEDAKDNLELAKA